MSFSTYPASPVLGRKFAGSPWLLGEQNDRHNLGFLMTGKFAGLGVDLFEGLSCGLRTMANRLWFAKGWALSVRGRAITGFFKMVHFKHTVPRCNRP